MFPGNPNKPIFPRDWSQDKIMHYILDVATDSSLLGKVSYRSGARGIRHEIIGMRDNVNVKVVVENGIQIITGYPIK